MLAELQDFLCAHYPGGPFVIEETFETNGQRLACRVRGADGQYVVKVTDPGRLEASVRADVMTPAYLVRQGFPAPHSLTTLDGQLYLPYPGERFVYLYDYLPGSAPSPGPDFYRRLGHMLAALHSLPWDASLPQSPYQPRDVLVGVRPLITAVDDPTQRPAAAELLNLIDHFPSFEDLPQGIIHSDPYFVNLLETPGGLCLIDWDDGGVSYPLLDVAYVLGHLCTFTAHDRAKWGVPGDPEGLLWRPDWADAFLAAYESVRPLTASERKRLPDAIRLSFIVYTPDWGQNRLILDNYQRMKMVEKKYI